MTTRTKTKSYIWCIGILGLVHVPVKKTEKTNRSKDLLVSLRDKIPAILQHIQKHQGTLEYNYRLYAAYEGQIKKEIENSMREEILSPQALRRALQRIPSINILKKAIDKVSTVYSEPVKRLATGRTDQEIMNNIVKMSRLDEAMLYADAMANLQKMAAIEPYVDNGVQKFRIYAAINSYHLAMTR